MISLSIKPYGVKHWYRNEVLHRDKGPAAEASNKKTKLWYSNNQIHRVDGPAVSSYNTNHWYWYGQRVTEYEHIMLYGQNQVNG